MSLPGRFITIGGQRMFVHRAGKGQDQDHRKGRPLLLLHGFLLSHWSLRRVIPGLAADHDVIAIDLPGFGESDRPSPDRYRYDELGLAETVVGVLDELGLERASILGHSLGGAVALATAARHPDRVERLALVAPLVYPFSLPPEGRALLLPYLGPLMFRTLYTRGVLRRYLTRVYRDASLVTEEWVDYLWERVNRPGGIEAARAALRLCADPSPIGRLLRAVRAPSHVIWGEDDRIFPVGLATRLIAELPGAALTVLPRCGHAPCEEAPEATLEALRPFLTAREAGSRQGQGQGPAATATVHA